MSKTITYNSPLEKLVPPRREGGCEADGVCCNAIDLTPNPSPKRRGERIPKILNDWPDTRLPVQFSLQAEGLVSKKRETEGEVIIEVSASLSTKHDHTPNPSPKERGEKSVSSGVKSPLSFKERGLGGEVISKASSSPSEVKNPTLNIGLFGFGCVGQGLYDVLNHSQGLKASIGKICVKDKSKPRTIDMDYFTFNKHEVLASGEHNLIVELTSDADAALEIIGSSLAKGQSVVTAGKKVLAENFELLYRLQQQTGASLLYEAACAGSIPIIRTLEEYYDNELLSSVKGILNGSSNYILSKMEFDKLSYHDALKQAQLAGFAEADPALDVNGTDAKYKLCLLAAHAFGIIVKPSCIFNSGIQNITPFDINYAAQNNCRIKLIAGIEKDNGGYRAYVLPRFISRDSPLSNINYEFNGIEVEGVYSDKQFFVGKGAGSHPTGSAVLSDISAITYDYKYGYKKLKKRENLTPQPLFLETRPAAYEERGAMSESFGVVSPLSFKERGSGRRTGLTVGEVSPDFSQDHRFLESDFTIKLYIRYQGNSRDSLALLDIRSIEEEYTSAKGNYIIASVGFKSLFNLLNTPNDLFVCEV